MKIFLYIICFFHVKIYAANPTQLTLDLSQLDVDGGFSPAVKIVLLLTILSVAPAILLMMTSFTRIMIVLSFIRQAIGTPTMPPNQVLVGLALFLTLFTMAPVGEILQKEVLNPYFSKKINEEEAMERASKPIKKFMLNETQEGDLGLFYSLMNKKKPRNRIDIPLKYLIPAFMISELKTAFQIGFLIYIPFLIVDMVVSSILMAMGMLMLPPTVVSLPLKLMLFILVDGWRLVIDSLMKSFHLVT